MSNALEVAEWLDLMPARADLAAVAAAGVLATGRSSRLSAVSSEIMVATSEEGRVAPQEEQNRAVDKTSVPQDLHRAMEMRASIDRQYSKSTRSRREMEMAGTAA